MLCEKTKGKHIKTQKTLEMIKTTRSAKEDHLAPIPV